MPSIYFLRGKQRIFQIELSRYLCMRFGVRQVFKISRKVSRALSRQSWVAAFIVAVLFLLVFTLVRMLDSDKVWKSPEHCTAADCVVQIPLSYSQLSPRLLLVAVFSSLTTRARRDSLRATWVNHLNEIGNTPIQYRFILGVQELSPESKARLQAEADQYKDMILLEEVMNDYFSLANRTIAIMKFVSQQFKFSYLLKCDDDSFVDVLRICSELQGRKRHTRFFWGQLGRGLIRTTGLHKERHYYLCNDYITYAFGGGYILSWDIVVLLAQNAPHFNRYKCEDVSLGSWLAPYNIERKHDPRFNAESTSRGCKSVYLIDHKLQEVDMYDHQKSLEEEGVMCGSSNSWSKKDGYVYDWTVKPSLCCRDTIGVP